MRESYIILVLALMVFVGVVNYSPAASITQKARVIAYTSNWKTYADPAGRFSFQYPSKYRFDSGTHYMIHPYYLDKHLISIAQSTSIMPSKHLKFYRQTAVLSVSKTVRTDTSTCYRPDVQTKSGLKPEMIGTKNVNGVTYRFTTHEAGAAGNDISGMLYRTIHNKQCYEIALEVEFWPNPVEMDTQGLTEVKNMTPQGQNKLFQQETSLQKATLAELNQIFLTFNFRQ